MLNEIAVPPEDKVAFGVLWCQSPESETEVYWYLRPIFYGEVRKMRSISDLLRTAEDSELLYPVAARAVKRNFYMGDFFKVLRTTDKALQLEQQLVVMPKWVSNLNKVIECITDAKRAPTIKEGILPVERALRVIRDTRSDSFACNGVKRDLTDKRRKILSLIASLFDPISFLAPFLVRTKSSFNKSGKLVLTRINTPRQSSYRSGLNCRECWLVFQNS